MTAAVRCGITPAAFWGMTPAELMICIDVQREQDEAENERLVLAAWLTASYTRAKRLPDIREILRKQEHREMADDEMLEQAKMLNALFGGETIG